MAHQEICLYTVIGKDDTPTAEIKLLGKINNPEEVHDTFLEEYTVISHPKVTGQIYACNIVDSYLLSSKKLPILKIDIIYVKKLTSALVLQFVLYFNITEEIKSEEQLIGNAIQGFFSLDIIASTSCNTIDGAMVNYPGNKKIIEIAKQLTLDDSIIKIINSFIEKNEAKRKELYKDEYEDFDSPSVNKWNNEKNNGKKL